MNLLEFVILFTACCLFVWYCIYTPVVKWYDRKQAAKLKPYQPVHPPTVGEAKPIGGVKPESYKSHESVVPSKEFSKMASSLIQSVRTRKPYDTQL